jgi:hypothetical protein
MTAPSLRELQNNFWQAIGGHPNEAAVSGLLTSIEGGSALSSASRLRVYAEAYMIRLREVLAQDFPTVAVILGNEKFDVLARDYARAFPSRHPSVRHFGRSMAEFLNCRFDLPPYMAALAQLEWALIEVFDAPDCRPINICDLQDIDANDWPALKFAPIPALRMFQSNWPVPQLWKTPDAAILPAPTSIRVWRAPNYQVFHAPIESREYDALDSLIKGKSFAEICDAYGDLGPDEAARESTATFARWLADGIVAAVD